MYNTSETDACQAPARSPLDNGCISARDVSAGYVHGSLLPGGLVLKRSGLGCVVSGGLRGPIRGFSAASRRRLIERLMGVPWEEVAVVDKHLARARAVFVTLTYPEQFPDAWAAAKVHLRSLQKRLGRLPWLTLQWAVWKAEEQQRGAPHFHLVLVLEEEVSVRVLQDWLRRAWFEVVGTGDRWHLRRGVHIEVIHQCAGEMGRLMRYLVKYIGKVWQRVEDPDVPALTGRVWGVWGRIPQVVCCDVTFESRAGWVAFQRRVRRWASRSPYLSHLANAHGLRLFGGLELLQLFRGLNVLATAVEGGERVALFFGEEFESRSLFLNRAQRDYT